VALSLVVSEVSYFARKITRLLRLPDARRLTLGPQTLPRPSKNYRQAAL
jgi:hypothetical protein